MQFVTGSSDRDVRNLLRNFAVECQNMKHAINACSYAMFSVVVGEVCCCEVEIERFVLG